MDIGIVFPGQGSQIAGMGQDLCADSLRVRELYEQASLVLGYDLFKACQNHNGELNDTRVVQPAILVHSVACWYLVQEVLDQPVKIMTGHSLGEISAVVCAGGLEFSKAVSLVKLRAQLMSTCVQDGGMMVVFALPEEPIVRVCADVATPGHHVAIANRNAAEQWVLSGHRKALQEAGVRLESLGGVVKQLNISIPAHSMLMAPIVPQFEEAIRQAGPGSCQIPIISCISGELYAAAEEVTSMLSSQLTGCIDWPLTLSRFFGQGIDTILELGPKTVLRDLIRKEHPEICAISLGTVKEKVSTQRFLTATNKRAGTLATGLLNSQVEAFLLSCLRLAVGTPFLRDLSPVSFQQTIQIPYQEIIKDLDVLRESSETQPADMAILRRASQRTLGLLRAKGLDPEHYEMVFEQAATSHGVQDAIAEYLV